MYVILHTKFFRKRNRHDTKKFHGRYLEENISTDTQPETLSKGSTSIITKRYLLALTDENAPAFQEAFTRGAILTLTRPAQTHIDKLREVLSLEPEQVIPEDAQDTHNGERYQLNLVNSTLSICALTDWQKTVLFNGFLRLYNLQTIKPIYFVSIVLSYKVYPDKGRTYNKNSLLQ